jgi:hypothetical protein
MGDDREKKTDRSGTKLMETIEGESWGRDCGWVPLL